MRQRLSLLLGIFAIMALSNAIVPILPSFAEEEIWIQSAIYSAYFLGAFITVLPAGILSDRMGRVPLIRSGLILTVFSGILIVLYPSAIPVFIARSLEGIGAGLFVSSALSWVNSQKDHISLSGFFIAALNLGLVTGLLGTGFLAERMGPMGGTALLTAVAVLPLVLSIFLREVVSEVRIPAHLLHILRAYVWLFVSTLVLIGITGVVTALYPEYTGASPAILSIQIGMMYTATIVTSLIAPRIPLEPVPVIRIAAIFMGLAVLWCFFAPSFGFFAILSGFAVIGGLSGFAINAQLAFLAKTGVQQGGVMGLFNTSSYAGLTILPFIAGVIAQLHIIPGIDRFFPAFFSMAALTGLMAITIGWCSCDVLTD
jgi:MFS family permease